MLTPIVNPVRSETNLLRLTRSYESSVKKEERGIRRVPRVWSCSPTLSSVQGTRVCMCTYVCTCVCGGGGG